MTGTTTMTMTTPSDTEIVLTRTFRAPRPLVFAAFTEPDLLRRWFGARGWELVVCEIDLRIGGRWRYVSRGPDGAELAHGGVYREVVAPERVVSTESYDDQWVPGESVTTIVMTDEGGSTTVTTTLTYSSKEVRDLVTSFPMERGIAEGYERLDEVLRAQVGGAS
jgi:uncharacterized protein YndB with AHSA1/START domain